MVWGKKGKEERKPWLPELLQAQHLSWTRSLWKGTRGQGLCSQVLACKSLVEYTGSVSAWYEKEKGQLLVLRTLGLRALPIYCGQSSENWQ